MTDQRPDQVTEEPRLASLGVTGLSATKTGDILVGLRPASLGWDLIIWAPHSASMRLEGLVGTTSEHDGGILFRGPESVANAEWLRRQVDTLRPTAVGPGPSIGLGDRIGMATPGHIRAVAASSMTPVLAQQSARELERTGRTFAEVLASATFGVLAGGWHLPWGADADHLKTVGQLDSAVEAGFTTLTIDPSDHVQNVPLGASRATVRAAIDQVPWASLKDEPHQFARRYPKVIEWEGTVVPLDDERIAVAAARFGAAVAHVAAMHGQLQHGSRQTAVELEVAVDELPFPTTAVDHVFIATELRRLGVGIASFAPRFVGEFEKAIDYVGSPAAFNTDVVMHADLARRLGPYKLSLHSGSEKFAILSSFSRATFPRLHLKTSGTSYLLALRTIGLSDPALLRRIWVSALADYESARASYHVSASTHGLPRAQDLSDAALVGLLDHPASREVLHVTFGAILGTSGAPLGAGAGLRDEARACVWANREDYWSLTSSHLARHVAYLTDLPYG